MRETTGKQTAQPDVAVLIEQVFRMLTAKALEGRAQALNWEDRRRRSVSTMAIFHTESEAPKAIAQAYGHLIQEADRLGPIVRAHRPFFYGGDHGFTLELCVDAAPPTVYFHFSSPVAHR